MAQQAPLSPLGRGVGGEGCFVAVVWMRDGRDWKLTTDLSADAVNAHAAEGSKAGWIAEDLAGYETKGDDRYALLLRRSDKGALQGNWPL